MNHIGIDSSAARAGSAASSGHPCRFVVKGRERSVEASLQFAVYRALAFVLFPYDEEFKLVLKLAWGEKIRLALLGKICIYVCGLSSYLLSCGKINSPVIVFL